MKSSSPGGVPLTVSDLYSSDSSTPKKLSAMNRNELSYSKLASEIDEAQLAVFPKYQQNLQSLWKQIEAKDSLISALKDQVSGFEQERTYFLKYISQLQEKIRLSDNKDMHLSELRSQSEMLNKDVSVLSNELAIERSRYQELLYEKNEMQSDLVNCKTELSKLITIERAFEENKSHLSLLEKKYRKLKSDSENKLMQLQFENNMLKEKNQNLEFQFQESERRRKETCDISDQLSRNIKDEKYQSDVSTKEAEKWKSVSVELEDVVQMLRNDLEKQKQSKRDEILQLRSKLKESVDVLKNCNSSLQGILTVCQEFSDSNKFFSLEMENSWNEDIDCLRNRISRILKSSDDDIHSSSLPDGFLPLLHLIQSILSAIHKKTADNRSLILESSVRKETAEKALKALKALSSRWEHWEPWIHIAFRSFQECLPILQAAGLVAMDLPAPSQSFSSSSSDATLTMNRETAQSTAHFEVMGREKLEQFRSFGDSIGKVCKQWSRLQRENASLKERIVLLENEVVEIKAEKVKGERNIRNELEEKILRLKQRHGEVIADFERKMEECEQAVKITHYELEKEVQKTKFDSQHHLDVRLREVSLKENELIHEKTVIEARDRDLTSSLLHLFNYTLLLQSRSQDLVEQKHMLSLLCQRLLVMKKQVDKLSEDCLLLNTSNNVASEKSLSMSFDSLQRKRPIYLPTLRVVAILVVAVCRLRRLQLRSSKKGDSMSFPTQILYIPHIHERIMVAPIHWKLPCAAECIQLTPEAIALRLFQGLTKSSDSLSVDMNSSKSWTSYFNSSSLSRNTTKQAVHWRQKSTRRALSHDKKAGYFWYERLGSSDYEGSVQIKVLSDSIDDLVKKIHSNTHLQSILSTLKGDYDILQQKSIQSEEVLSEQSNRIEVLERQRTTHNHEVINLLREVTEGNSLIDFPSPEVHSKLSKSTSTIFSSNSFLTPSTTPVTKREQTSSLTQTPHSWLTISPVTNPNESMKKRDGEDSQLLGEYWILPHRGHHPSSSTSKDRLKGSSNKKKREISTSTSAIENSVDFQEGKSDHGILDFQHRELSDQYEDHSEEYLSVCDDVNRLTRRLRHHRANLSFEEE